MKIAVDTSIGRDGIRILRFFGHSVVVVAEEGEQDRDWFARAIAAGVDLVISPDTDLEILCYDHRVEFFRHKNGCSGHETVMRLMEQRNGTRRAG